MKRYYPLLFLLIVFFASCSKDKSTKPVTPVPPVTPKNPTLSSVDYVDSLLFVGSNNYQIKTSEAATSFTSTDPYLKMSSTGLITRLTSSEIAPIVITWKDASKPKTTIYALGATTINQDMPFALFQGDTASNAYASYLQGWKTLQKLPVAGETYAIVLRHADASYGRDFSTTHNYAGPANWWKSSDSLLARQLNAQGITRASVLGQVFKDLNYPVKRIITSEFYRSRQTATLMNLGITPVIDSRVNHPSYNLYAPGLYKGMLAILAEQPIDNQMTLIIAHHPINELLTVTGYPSFPDVSPFNWSGAYLIKIGSDGSITYEGAASWAMFKYWHDLKLNKL